MQHRSRLRPTLARAAPVFVRTAGSPFGVAVTTDDRYAFVAGIDGGIGVYALAGGHLRRVRTVAAGEAVGVSLTRDGRYLLAADGETGAEVIDVAHAEQGSPAAVLGDLTVMAARRRFGGAIEVASSADGRFAFVSEDGGGRIAVYDLRAALRDHRFGSAYVGSIPVGVAPVGLAVSPDGRWLYSTSEDGARGRPNDGLLAVIDVRTAERDPAHAVVARVVAHCSPVRVVVSADGRRVWVTARESDQLLAFSAARLRSDPARSLEAVVRVGEAPVGLALVDRGRDGELLVGNFGSSRLELVRVGGL